MASALSPFSPLFERGHTRLQPAYVGDTAEAIALAMQDSHSEMCYEAPRRLPIQFQLDLRRYHSRLDARAQQYLLSPDVTFKAADVKQEMGEFMG